MLSLACWLFKGEMSLVVLTRVWYGKEKKLRKTPETSFTWITVTLLFDEIQKLLQVKNNFRKFTQCWKIDSFSDLHIQESFPNQHLSLCLFILFLSSMYSGNWVLNLFSPNPILFMKWKVQPLSKSAKEMSVWAFWSSLLVSSPTFLFSSRNLISHSGPYIHYLLQSPQNLVT